VLATAPTALTANVPSKGVWFDYDTGGLQFSSRSACRLESGGIALIFTQGTHPMRDYRFWLCLAVLLVAGRVLYPAFAGDRSSPIREDERREIMYVCRESGETFPLRAKATYEKHPRTGRLTLMPGLYCTKCGVWRASPPLDVLQQSPSARLCPKDGSPMSVAGPLPEKK